MKSEAEVRALLRDYPNDPERDPQDWIRKTLLWVLEEQA